MNGKKFHQDFPAAVANPPSVPGHKCPAPGKNIKHVFISVAKSRVAEYKY